jgi:hypothetical protein
MPNVGAELASVPFGRMIYDMASAIARSQSALDQSSIALVQVLASSTFAYIPDVVETLTPAPRQVMVGGDPDNGIPPSGLLDAHGNKVMVTGIHVDYDVSEPFAMTLLQAGVNPTFYQFTNSTIVIKMAVTSTTEVDDTITTSTSITGRQFWFGGGSVASHVNASYAGKYSYDVAGSSSLSTTLACVPPPKNMMPRFFLVNAMNPNAIQVNQS